MSINGGRKPHWKNDGRELIYEDLSGAIMAVDVLPGPEFRTGVPRRLFSIAPESPWDATGDHQRFLVSVRLRDRRPEPLRVVTGWVDRFGKGR